MGRGGFFLCCGAVAEQVEETAKKKKMETTEQLQPPPPQQEQEQEQELKVLFHKSDSLSLSANISKEDKEMATSALSNFRDKEEEIEKRKKEVQDRLLSQLGRAEQETKRLANLREELETFADPVGKELSLVRKKIDSLNKELVSFGQTCQKKEREYKEAVNSLNDKNKEKVQLITKLKELVVESESWRMKKLEELSNNL